MFELKGKIKAFTLAEVLITLSIIGIVASLTIPNMMASYQKHVYVTRLKKFYSVFQQGFKGYSASIGCNDLKCTGLFDTTKSNFESDFLTEIKKIFRIDKSCVVLQDNCLSENVIALNGDKGVLNGIFYDSYTFRTHDGFVFEITPVNCNAYTTYDSKLKNGCGYLFVDVNANNKPNQMGRDIFLFYIGNNSVLYPQYGQEYSKANNNNDYWKTLSSDPLGCGTAGSSTIGSNNRGYSCAARIMEEGWEMNY